MIRFEAENKPFDFRARDGHAEQPLRQHCNGRIRRPPPPPPSHRLSFAVNGNISQEGFALINDLRLLPFFSSWPYARTANVSIPPF